MNDKTIRWWLVLSSLFFASFSLAELPRAVNTVTPLRPASGNLLTPAIQGSEYEERVYAAVLGWAFGAAVAQSRYLGEPISPFQFPLPEEPKGPALPINTPSNLPPHVIYPIETLLALDHEPSPEEYLATWKRHAVQLSGTPALALERGKPVGDKESEGSALFTGALMLGLASPGMPDLAAQRAHDAYVFAYPENSLVAAMYIAAMASAACVDRDWNRIQNAGVAELPKDSMVRKTVDALQKMETERLSYEVETAQIHNKMARMLPWSDPILNLSALLISLENGQGEARHTLRYALSTGYDGPTNAGIAFGIVGARMGIPAIPTSWNASMPKGLHLKSRNVSVFRIRKFADTVGDASVTVEFPITDLAKRIAEAGKKSLIARGGRDIGEPPQDALLLPRQEHLETNLRQLKAKLGRDPERSSKNTPIADHVEQSYRDLIASATKLSLDQFWRGWLDLSTFAARSRNKAAGHDAVRICQDWHKIFSAAGADLAGWLVKATVKPPRLAKGDKAEVTVEFQNRSAIPLDAVTVDLEAGYNSKLSAEKTVKDQVVAPSGSVQAVYSLQTNKEAPLGAHPFKAEVRIKQGTSEYLLLGDVQARVVRPVLWEASMVWKGEAVQILQIQLSNDSDEAVRDVRIRTTGTPESVRLEPSQTQKQLRSNIPSVAGFRILESTDTKHMPLLLHAWSAYGVEIACGSDVMPATCVLPAGPIRQVDAEYAVPILEVRDGRRAYRMDPPSGVRRLVFDVNNGELQMKSPPLRIRLDYYIQEKKDRILRLEYPGPERRTAFKEIPLAGEAGWNNAEVTLDDIDLSRPHPRLILQTRDEEPLVLGRILPLLIKQ